VCYLMQYTLRIHITIYINQPHLLKGQYVACEGYSLIQIQLGLRLMIKNIICMGQIIAKMPYLAIFPSIGGAFEDCSVFQLDSRCYAATRKYMFGCRTFFCAHCKSDGSKIETCFIKIVLNTVVYDFCFCSPTI